jgi:two-component system sensor histidine kinase KdpD
LILNAANHTPADTAIEFSAQLADEVLSLSVADLGPGIPPEWLPRIFEKFFRAPTAPTGGSGLGLTIVKGFVEAHGGSIAAENRAGGGARFTIKLPQPEKAPSVEPG